MAKRKEKVILEDVELKPQVIGYTYQKKSNIGRVIFMFVIFILMIVYINDISVFINDLLGRDSAESIQNLAGNNKNENQENSDIKKEVIYNVYSNDLVINENNFSLNNFSLNNNVLTFDAVNNSSNTINLTSNKYFIEIYTETKTLLERFKLDIDIINSGSKRSYNYDLSNSFYYLVLVEKTIEDYPVVNIKQNEDGYQQLSCIKDYETIIYKFRENKLQFINHTVSNSDVSNNQYYSMYSSHQNKVNNYKGLEGFTATFNGTLNGYTAIIDINLMYANLSTVAEKYYYGYNEEPRVVDFEMQTYGFTCN